MLRVLEYGELERLGGSQTLQVDVRIIAATNKDLEKTIENGAFRQDLYYRLNVVPIAVPSLRERIDDLFLLVKHFVEQFYRETVRPPKIIDPSAIRVLQSYNWPGNIRELKNIVERLLIMVDRDVIRADDATNVLPISHGSSHPNTDTIRPRENRYQTDTSLAAMVDEAEANFILEGLEANDWNIKRTAEQLKIERSNFYKKLTKYNIKRPDDS